MQLINLVSDLVVPIARPKLDLPVYQFRLRKSIVLQVVCVDLALLVCRKIKASECENEADNHRSVKVRLELREGGSLP